MLAEKGDFEGAIVEFSETLNLNPGDPLAVKNLQLARQITATSAELASMEKLSWKDDQYQSKCRLRAQFVLPGDEEVIARKLATLYQAYNRVGNAKAEEDKAESERIKTEAAEIGYSLCGSGGAKKMLLVAFRAAQHGARLRSIELFWDGICGWEF